MSAPKIRNKFSPRVPKIFNSQKADRTQQHFAREVDINNILAKYRKTGTIDHINQTKLRFGDFRDLADFCGDMDKITKAQQAFDHLPSSLRKEFGNSPSDFFAYIGKEENFDKCVQMGIFNARKEIKAPAEPTPEPVPPGSKKDGSPKKTPVSNPKPDQE